MVKDKAAKREADLERLTNALMIYREAKNEAGLSRRHWQQEDVLTLPAGQFIKLNLRREVALKLHREVCPGRVVVFCGDLWDAQYFDPDTRVPVTVLD